MTEPMPPGRRERKKLETRDALLAAARTLFAEHGFAGTSIQQITEAADVSERTFFRYFISKYDLLLPDLDALFDAIGSALAARPADEHPLEAYEAALVSVIAEQAAESGLPTVLASVVAERAADGGDTSARAPGADPSEPAVSGRLVRAFIAWEERLGDLFADRLRAGPAAGQDPADIELQAAVTAGVAAATTRAVVRLLRRQPAARIRAADLLQTAFAVARAGCESTALPRRSGARAPKAPR